MTHPRPSILVPVALLAVLAVGLTACSSDDSSSESTTTAARSTSQTTVKEDSGELTGTFGIVAGDCAAGAVTSGSYFRMVSTGGSTTAGPFVPNADSACGDKSYTALTPGTEGGLRTGAYQPQPAPPFDAANNGVADKITKPTTFFGVGFAVSTNETDPVGGTTLTQPSITVADGQLSGSLAAVSVAWNGQQFNQGAPKPDGSTPGLTAAPTGTYDAATGAYTLDWSSEIVGGPFNGFTGVWHLEGTFEKS